MRSWLRRAVPEPVEDGGRDDNAAGDDLLHRVGKAELGAAFGHDTHN